jgi:hypothetical protein
MRVLFLVLSQKAFDITGTIEKPFELRNDSKWIRSRLFNKDGSLRQYDVVVFQNGYRAKAEVKTFKFLRTEILKSRKKWNFSNDLKFITGKGDYKILLDR